MRILGLDLGGANLKLASPDGRSAAASFPLWKQPRQLGQRLAHLAEPWGSVDRVAVTMTGELADCFATKAEGVDCILQEIQQAFPAAELCIWSTAGRFLSTDEARRHPLSVAAANWHAQATWAGRFHRHGCAVLIDIGSTTSDLIPLIDGVPRPCGMTDPQRLLSGELVYRGVRRTPLLALGPTLSCSQAEFPHAAELFATTLDVFLLLGELPENPDSTDTANGRPATREAASDRLVRMACSDRTELTESEARRAAARYRERLMAELARALRGVVQRLPGPCGAAITSGSGEFLARDLVEQVLKVEPVSLSRQLSPALAESACAWAVAVLGDELWNPAAPGARSL